MLTLHYLERSRSFRILWALEELQKTYEIKYYKRSITFSAPAELKKIHPLGKAPILQDDDDVIAESAVILEYLQNKYDQQHQFKPQKDIDVYQYLYWMHYAEGSLMPLLMFQFVMNKVSEKVPFLIRPIVNIMTTAIKANFSQPRLNEHIAFVEDHLSKHDYFAGNFSFADIQMSFALEALSSINADKCPHIQSFLTRVQDRSAYKKAKKTIETLNANEKLDF